ncbi:MAG TPA: glycosyltransferase family 4 protein [Herpetosiphonaceae bacterium]|nr:glycosyltransferase family 4 protein [Herpetosiphonaceae bacterium]
MKIAFVTNICPHYRRPTFELLAKRSDTDFYFFSAGDEWYWQQAHGVERGDFRHQYLRGWRIGRTRITPTLPWKLLRGGYDVYVKCINGKFALPVTFLIARLRRKPFVLWTGVWMRLQTPIHRLIFPLTRFIYRHADAVVVYGEHVKRYLASEGVDPARIFVAAHAVDNAAYGQPVDPAELAALRGRLGLDEAGAVVLSLGRLVAEKGYDYLLRAWAAAGESVGRARATLLIVGEGDDRGRLEALAAALGVAATVRFAGYVPAGETRPFYALADLFVLPSVTTASFKEPWGLVVNEAFNQGAPVIASDAVGAAAGGMVRPGVNGLIVPERDSGTLARALADLLDRPELRRSMGAAARATVAMWTNERMVEGFLRAVAAAAGVPRNGEE